MEFIFYFSFFKFFEMPLNIGIRDRIARILTSHHEVDREAWRYSSNLINKILIRISKMHSQKQKPLHANSFKSSKLSKFLS